MTEWIEHDGMGCPLAIGARVALRTVSEGDHESVVTENSHKPSRREDGFFVINSWRWAIDGISAPRRFHILAYRILGKSGDERREDYQALFDSWTRGNEVTPPPQAVPLPINGAEKSA